MTSNTGLKLINTSKILGGMIKPFLTNKVHIKGEEIISKTENEIMKDNTVMVQLISHKLCQKSVWKKSHFAHDKMPHTTQAIYLIFQSYLVHSSNNRINSISKNQISSIVFSRNFCGTKAEEIFKLLNALYTKKLLVLI